MRLDKYLSKALGLTRKEAKEVIRRGEVTVNGEVIKKADYKVPEGATVLVEGRAVGSVGPVYLMLYKPKGYLSTTERDKDYPSFLDLIPEYEHLKPFAAGRLDVDAEGFLLVTTDGQLAHRITHPKWKVPKTYEVELEKPLTPEQEEKILKGVELDGKPVKVEKLEKLSESRVLLTLSEGRFHVVKRLFKEVGNRVTNLKRVKIGPIELDPALAEGEYRELTPEEVRELKKLVRLEET
ncbi:MAG: rRNA pseudouridine synthase [Aquificae bacterium]|nr:rRNA pseudouridine synthase [Aquificota bacterium]